jgi:hypothetical protein
MTDWEPDPDEALEDEVDEEYRPQRTRTQAELDAYNLARDRRRRTNAGSRMVAKSPEASERDAPVDTVNTMNTDRSPSKPATKRGGARPGAGRKRKKTTGNAQDKSLEVSVQASPASAAGNTSMPATGDIDSDDEPLTQPRSGRSTSHNEEPRFKLKTSPIVTPSRRSGRKRKASEIAETPEEGTNPRSNGAETPNSFHDSDDDDEDDDNEGGGIIRSRRKRQKPLRYQETD